MSSILVAPWKPLLSSSISVFNPPTVTLATVTPSPPHFPRLRTLIFRGFFGSLPPNDRNSATPNPRVYESNMLTFTTDGRMEKVRELGRGEGGGEVEFCFWASDVQVQWRVRGVCWILGGSGEGEEKARREVERGLERREDASDGEAGNWSFNREVTAHFGNLSPIMRGTFRNPLPGTPRISNADGSLPDEEGGLRLGEEVHDLEDRVARENFRIGVVVPRWVERLDLTRPRRTAWRVGDGGWEEREVWP
jgi:pyridoxamine 5'-phosphate oxidase